MSRQAGKAPRAAATAARVSSAVESGTWPRTSRVSAGLTLGTERAASEATHSPPMKLR